MQLSFDMPEMSPRDRAGFTLFGSALLHLVIIMGIGFTYTLGQSVNREQPTIDTAVADYQSEEPVDDTETFAKFAQAGGGLSDSEEPLRSPLPFVDDPETSLERMSAAEANARALDATFVYVELPESVLLSLEEQQPEENRSSDTRDQVGAEAMVRSPLSATLDPEFSAGLRVPRQKFISSRTREHKYASYMEAWRSRVEEVGNTNYPEEATRRRLSGNLVLDVAIRSDGSIQGIDVVRSSGQKILDDAAIRIVMMAAPFDEFPEEILKEADVIHITRTWQFLHNSTLIQN